MASPVKVREGRVALIPAAAAELVNHELYCLMHNIEKLAHHGYAVQSSNGSPREAIETIRTTLHVSLEGGDQAVIKKEIGAMA